MFPLPSVPAPLCHRHLHRRAAMPWPSCATGRRLHAVPALSLRQHCGVQPMLYLFLWAPALVQSLFSFQSTHSS